MRWRYGFYPTTLLETAIILAVVVFALETWRGHLALQWRTPFTIPALLFILAGAISVLVAPSRTAGLGLYRAYIIEPIAFAFVLMHAVTTWRRALAVVSGFGVAGIVVGLANSILVIAALRAHTYDVTQTPPVVTAVAVGLALSHRRRWLLLAGLVIAGGLVSAIPPIFHRISIEFQNVGGTTFFGRAGRLELWSATLKMLSHYPIFGAGLSGFAERIGPYWNANHPERFIDPHNIVLNFWVETGLLGVFAFAWLLVVVFRISWEGWLPSGAPRHLPTGWGGQSDSDWRPIFLGVLLAMVAIVVHGLVDVPYFKNDLSLLFWALAGIAAAGQKTLKTGLR